MDTYSEYKYKNKLTISNKASRLAWIIVYNTAFRTTPNWGMNYWRISLLRLFGAKIGIGCKISPKTKIWAPWNLHAGSYVCFAEDVDCYNVDTIHIGSKVTISQRTFLCTASHRTTTLQRELVHSPITIMDHVWICSECFIKPGITINTGAVVAARSVVTRDIKAWSISGGHPARHIKDRVVRPS